MTVLTERDRAIVAAVTGRHALVIQSVTQTVTRRHAATTRLCWYCGAPTLRPLACAGHADLPALDPAIHPHEGGTL